MSTLLRMPTPAPTLDFVEAVARRVVELLEERGLAEERRLMDIPTAALYIGRTDRAVERMIDKGTLPIVKLDGRTQIDRRRLDELIKQREVWAA